MQQGDGAARRLTEAARAHLDPEVAGAWLAMLEPGTRLRAASEPRAGEHGSGWLGGLPALPPDRDWPSWRHGPLGHVATVDCAAVAPAPPRLCAAGFPGQGWLSFFYWDEGDDGDGSTTVGAFFPGTADGARVVYTPPDKAGLADAPAGVTRYPRVPLAAGPVLTWPDPEHPRLPAGSPSDAGWDAVLEAADSLPGARDAAHQVGGYATPVQGSVETEVAYGLATRGGLDRREAADPAIRDVATDLILLAQFDTDPAAGFSWGDHGMLYYLIRPADLAAGRFERAHFTWQCF